MKINCEMAIYILKIYEKNGFEKNELFLNCEMAIERFNYLKMINYTSLVEKMEIKAIYGLLNGDMVKSLENNSLDELENLDELYKKGKLMAIYPRPQKLNDIVPYLTPKLFTDQSGIRKKAAEKLLYEPIRFDAFSIDKLSRICECLNLSIYIFLK